VGGPGQDVNKTCIQKTSEWYDLDLIKYQFARMFLCSSYVNISMTHNALKPSKFYQSLFQYLMSYRMTKREPSVQVYQFSVLLK